MSDPKDFQSRAETIEALVQRVREFPDEHARSTALELLQAVMDMHASVLDRMLELTSKAGDTGEKLLDQFGGDPLVSGLLVLYDLHPHDLDTRLMAALDKVRPFLQSHGGDVELTGFRDGILTVRLTGSCNGCGSSTLTMKNKVEQAVYEAAPEVSAVTVETNDTAQLQGAAGFVPLAKLQSAA